jgi:hypothetical protein
MITIIFLNKLLFTLNHKKMFSLFIIFGGESISNEFKTPLFKFVASNLIDFKSSLKIQSIGA